MRPDVACKSAPGSTRGPQRAAQMATSSNHCPRNTLSDPMFCSTASLEPYFSSSGAYVDPRSTAELNTSGLHASVVAYDSESRPTCTIYEPAAGSILPAPASASACFSNYAEVPSANSRRATQTAYGVDSSLDGRAYMTADTIASWAAFGPRLRASISTRWAASGTRKRRAAPLAASMAIVTTRAFSASDNFPSVNSASGRAASGDASRPGTAVLRSCRARTPRAPMP